LLKQYRAKNKKGVVGMPGINLTTAPMDIARRPRAIYMIFFKVSPAFLK